MKKALASLLGFLCSFIVAFADNSDYVKVTSTPTDWSGEYLIVYEKSRTEAWVFNGSLTTLDGSSNYVTATISNGQIKADDSKQFTIASITGGYSIKSASGLFLGNSGKGSLTQNPSNASAHTITLTSNGDDITITTNNNNLRFNTSAKRFRYYSSGQAAITLYKKVASAPDKRTPVNLTSFTAKETTLTKGETTTTSVVNDQAGWTANYKYTSSNKSVATVDEDGVITAVGKGTATITVTAVFDNDKEYKAGETTSLTVNITVNNKKHTVTFLANGQEVSSTSMEEGSAITFTDDLNAQYVPAGQTFMGWAAAAFEGSQENAPALVKSATVGTTDVTYYAVFATGSTSGNANWVKKTVKQVVDNPEAGDYALITPDGHAYNGKIDGGHGQTTDDAFVFPATNAPDGTCLLTITQIKATKGNGIEIARKDNGNVIYANAASSKNFAEGKSQGSYWYANGSKFIYAKNSAYLRTYSNSFRTYSSASGDSIAFAYRSSTTYTNYCTTVGGADTREFVKFTAWNTSNGETTLVKSNTLATVATLNPAECTTGTITYTSNNPEVATINAEGVITAVAKGEATLVATLSIAEDDTNYRLSSQEYQQTLTIHVINPKHTVTFMADGEVVESKNVREEEAISFPTVTAPEGLVFIGWTEKGLKGMATEAPALVDTTASVMGEYDMTFVAVYARVAQKGEIKQYKLTADMIKEHFAISDYKVEQVWTDESENVKWIACAVTSQGGADSFLQIKNGSGYIGFETPYAIKNVSFYLTNGSNTEIEGSFNILTDKDDTKTEFMYVNAGPNASIDIEGNHNQLYITANGTNASRIRNIVLTCQDEDRYLGYVTNSKDANTARKVDVTVAACGYTTVCLPYNAVAQEGAKFFALKSVDKDGLHFTSTEKLAAGQGYVLQGEKEAVYTLTEVLEAVDYNANLLKGVIDDTNCMDLTLTGTGEYAYPWILAKDGTFKRYTGAYIPAGKAYLDGALLQDLQANQASALRVILEEDEVTALSQLHEEKATAPCFYNLQGQRVAQPRQAGALYIESNGRKIIVK